MPKIMDEDGTPCPVRTTSVNSFLNSPLNIYRDALSGDDDDNTANIDFTVALPDIEPFLNRDTRKREGKGLKEPPRRITNYVPPVRHEPQPLPQQKERKTNAGVGGRKSTEDQQAAPVHRQEPERRPQGALQQQPQRSLIGGLGAMRPSRRRVSALLKAKNLEQAAAQDVARAPLPESRPARTSNEAVGKPTALIDKARNSPMVKLVEKQLFGGEQKQLKAPPKRLTMMPATKPRQTMAPIGGARDRNSGKENLQPTERDTRKRAADKWDKSPTRKSVRLSDDPVRRRAQKAAPPVKPPAPTAVPKNPNKSRKRNSDDISFDEGSSFTSQSSSTYTDSFGTLRLRKRAKKSIASLPTPPGLTQEEENDLLPPSEFLIPGTTSYQPNPAKKRPLDPVLAEDIERCEMYEESWLSAQESSVSQLLNHLLATFSPTPTGKKRLALRKEFLLMYSAQPFPLTYGRVHASLLYGALSITQYVLSGSSVARTFRVPPKNSFPVASGWGTDVGAREKFLEIFMKSYDQSVLITALEVVVGREMFAYAMPGESEKKVLETYMDRYLINSEDILSTHFEPIQVPKKGVKLGGNAKGDEDIGTPAWMLRRTILRSFMLILLLDKAKSRGALGRQCLFKKESTLKSSLEVLRAVSKLLIPSHGDISKPMSHLNYTLEAVQDPLSEFDYKIDNIAVDMRDGIRLTRVAEVLLRSKGRQSLSGEQDDEEDDWPLSLHLQHPATSRVQKMHNVNLALSALDNAGGKPHRIEAKDIVDGYREKTVGLLWGLLSQWGLELLLDWNTVINETARLETKESSDRANDVVSDSRDYVGLLKNWATCIAAKHGLVVTNLTTSFADGKVFTAIVSEYERYLPSYAKSGPAASLQIKLRGIGCNSYFAGLFETEDNGGRVFTKDFVVAGLAYLCSRLVQPSIQQRAATMIQRVYRNVVFRANVHKRIRLVILAHHCADIINKRNAAITIQRAFRKYVHKKIELLIRSTVAFQSLGRGVLARRALEDARWAAAAIQRRWRAVREAKYHERIGVAKGAIVGVQAIIRGILARNNVHGLKRSVKVIEAVWKKVIVGRQARDAYLLQRAATIGIQRAFRRYIRSKKERQLFLETRWSVVQLQSLARGQLIRLQCVDRVVDIRYIQFWYRRLTEMRKVRAEYVRLRSATIFVQQRRRETVLTRELSAKYQLMVACVSLIKMRYLEKKRIAKAAVVLQRAWRARAWVVRMNRLGERAVVIQSAWRGYLVRKESGPRLRVIRKRIQKISNGKVAEEDTIGAQTTKALEMVQKKALFARAIAVLESKTRISSECAVIVAGDEVGFAAILACIDTSVVQVQKTAMAAAVRTLTHSIDTIANVARVPSCRNVLAGRQVGKSGKDIFTVILHCIETLKTASMRTPQYELLLTAMRILVSFATTDSIRRKLCAKKKWTEKLMTTLKDVENTGRRRGAAVDTPKSQILTQLFSVFGDVQQKA